MAAYATPEVQADYNIQVHLVDGAHAVPDIPSTMKKGQLVRYSSPDGKVTVTFDNGSPFLDAVGQAITTVQDSQILKLMNEGDFFCKCSLALPKGQTIAWFEGEDPQSGGDHHVGH